MRSIFEGLLENKELTVSLKELSEKFKGEYSNKEIYYEWKYSVFNAIHDGIKDDFEKLSKRR